MVHEKEDPWESQRLKKGSEVFILFYKCQCRGVYGDILAEAKQTLLSPLTLSIEAKISVEGGQWNMWLIVSAFSWAFSFSIVAVLRHDRLLQNSLTLLLFSPWYFLKPVGVGRYSTNRLTLKH